MSRRTPFDDWQSRWAANFAARVAAGAPQRCKTNEIGQMGECIACDADNGESCRAPAEQGETNV